MLNSLSYTFYSCKKRYYYVRSSMELSGTDSILRTIHIYNDIARTVLASRLILLISQLVKVKL